MSRTRASGVIIGQVEQDELRQLLRGSLPFYEFVKLAEKFVGAKLVGIVGVEVGKERVEVISQSSFCRTHLVSYRNRPWPWAWTSARTSDVRWQRISFCDFGLGTRGRFGRRGTFLR